MKKPQILLLASLLCCAFAAPFAIGDRAAARTVEPTRVAGQAVYQKWCSDCHSTATGPGSIALQRHYQGNPPAILLQRTNMSPDLVKAAVRNGVSFMPSFRKTEISDAELAALADYLVSGKRTPPPAKNRP